MDDYTKASLDRLSELWAVQRRPTDDRDWDYERHLIQQAQAEALVSIAYSLDYYISYRT